MHSIKVLQKKGREADLIVAQAPAPEAPLGGSIHRLPTLSSNRPDIDSQTSLHAETKAYDCFSAICT